jgi:LysM repeat protein
MWTKSACVVLAWGSILMIVVVAAGMSQPGHPAQANIHIASITTEVTGASAVSVAAVFVTAARPAAGYVVQPGDTLSGIAARLAVRGGWPALYAANRRVIGPDPDVIHVGTVLVLPGRMALARYTVAAGDTLAAIAAALAVRGGWPALYAANRRVIGPDPGVIRPGTVLVLPRPAAPSPPVSSPGRRVPPAPPSAPTGSRHRPGPAAAPAAGMPGWLKTVLLAAGLLIGAAFLAEPVLIVRRRRRTAAASAAAAGESPGSGTPAAGPAQPPGAGTPAVRPAQPPGAGPPAAGEARIVLADYARLVVTHSTADDAVYVLRPPGEDPAAILRAARLVVPEGLYRELAGRLGLPASWPIVVADYDRLVVTCSARDGTVYVLRPPGEDPRLVLKAARLVLPEDPYQELAEQLGLPASWPAERGCPGPPE